MSKKRKREVDIELVKVYEELADENEPVRLKAAMTLVSIIFKPGVTSEEQTKSIITRLFRGLCSGRKAARLGFSVALTELLSKLPVSSDAFPTATVPTSSVVDLLEANTMPEGGTSGQEERDHYFGRIFGAEAVLKSGILFKTPQPVQWKRVLDLICAVALKKPWLRQTCGRALYNCILSNDSKLVTETFVIDTISAFDTYRLIRTPEGVAVWIAATRAFPQAQLPKSLWYDEDPLGSKGMNSLAVILVDARTHSDGSDEAFEAQGSAAWSANLHFAWDVVLSDLYQARPTSEQNGHRPVKRVGFETFWLTVVDDGLFADTSSTERKAWGLSLWKKVFETAPQTYLEYTFSHRALNCLVNSLRATDRYLQKLAQRVSQVFPTRLSGSALVSTDYGLVGTCIQSLLESVSFGDFDQITKSKTMLNILEVEQPSVQEAIFLTLEKLLNASLNEDEEKERSTQQKTVIALQGKLLAASLRHLEQQLATDEVKLAQLNVSRMILKAWVQRGYVSSQTPSSNALPQSFFTEQARKLLKDRLASGFEQTLKLGKPGIELLRETLLCVSQLEKDGVSLAVQFEEEIKASVRKGWKKLAKMKVSEGPYINTTRYKQSTGSIQDGLVLLYCLVLFQIYNGEAEAVEILQEVIALDDDLKAKRKRVSTSISDDVSIIQILLGFASRPSKFMRRITIQMFEAFAPQVSREGLQSLCDVLEAKENAQGQQEMFEERDTEMNEDDADSIGSDVDELGSDVEVLDASEDGDDESSTGSESENEQQNDDEAEEEDDELAAFDAALASALGTRQLNENDTDPTSDSDSDMDDDEMMELDSKLVEVFRAREEQQSKNKQRSAKDAKENIINFKNRVLDLIESYLKQQYQNALAIDLILPLLRLVRTTQAKQVATRAGDILRGLASRCKGQLIPELAGVDGLKHATSELVKIHEEAGLQSSNLHSTLASLGSILVVKAMTKSHPGSIRAVIDIYASTRLKQLTKESCFITPGFFTDWNNWCQSMEKKLAQ
ncbi:uncharacterized protein A1O9_05951 [Exophiala aquamarina CBS 119918]|uniref:DNA polymerase V n=1 Tax=Exophiala aquamarina CBS 119918 TaxID=1182545 RepID=A0A072PFH0_9EURO|nr:uncharacterized protein A1O9_05951 [Exophiala aquamarina CBS 119918]KEF58028.1 hypothetical protein A1O9_05951 [Exophiala aquamarina CBS 119918]